MFISAVSEFNTMVAFGGLEIADVLRALIINNPDMATTNTRAPAKLPTIIG